MEIRPPMINRRHALLLARARSFARCRARLARQRAHKIAWAIHPRIRALRHQNPSARPHTHLPTRGPQQSPSRQQTPMRAHRPVRRRARSLPPHRHQSCALRQSRRRALHRARCCDREMRYSVDGGARTLFPDDLHAALRETAREPTRAPSIASGVESRRIRLHTRPLAVHHKCLIYEPSFHGTA